MGERGERCVQSVVKAMAVLDCLARRQGPMSLGELSAELGWPKASVHGLLAAMRQNGVVEQSGADGKYRLGIRLFSYGCIVSASWDVVRRSREKMDHIALQTGNSVFLSTLEADSAMIIETAAATGAFQVISEKGSRVPLHCTSQGKLLLAYQSPGQRRLLLQKLNFQSYTPHTIDSLPRLEEELALIRTQGFATEDGEYRIGLRSASAPIFGVDGGVCAALGVVGMFRRVRSEEFQYALELVCQAAAEISFDMGYRPGEPKRRGTGTLL